MCPSSAQADPAMNEAGVQAGRDIALVLGSGGARGLAHIGVIRVLEQAGYRVRALAGSSMGALVGGIYAAGKLADYTDWVSRLEHADVLKLIDWTLSGGGLIRGKRLIDELEELVGDVDIASLPIDFTAVAVDLHQGREVWLSEGSLFDALRASIAIPGLFTPHRYRGRTLIDGGILNPIPVAPTLRCLTDMTVVVNVNGRLQAGDARTPADKPAEIEDDHRGSLLQKLKHLVSGSTDDEPGDEGPIPGLTGVLLRSLEIMESAITRQHLAVFQPDLVITIPKDACMIHEFHRARELISLGEKRAREAVSSGPGVRAA